VDDIVAAGAVPLVLGGEHSIPAMVLLAISKRRKSKAGIIWFDAHYDLHWEPCPLNEASALHQIHTTTRNDPKNLVIVGIQGCQNLLNWQAAAAGIGATVFTMTEVEELGIDEVTRRAIRVAARDCEQVYVSIDADVFA
jgi:arginase